MPPSHLGLAAAASLLAAARAAPLVGTTSASAQPPSRAPHAPQPPITPGSANHHWRHLAPPPRRAGAPNIPMWSSIYDFDYETNGTGTTTFTNLLWVRVPIPTPPRLGLSRSAPPACRTQT